jgi:hypothetical protein
MRYRVGMLGMSLVLTLFGRLEAQDMFKDVEYQAGKDGFADKIKGTLIVAPQALRFMDQTGKLTFSIPVEAITDVKNDIQIRDASAGKKLLFGGLAGSRKQEFVMITSETAESAEGVVFKVKQNESLNMVAKIRFAMKGAEVRRDRDSTMASAVVDSGLH